MTYKSFLKRVSPPAVRKVVRAVRARYIERCIETLWRQDCAALPLTKLHKPLYFTIQRLCQLHLGRFANLQHCQDFNDRIQWLKLFDQTVDHVRCSDKVGIRSYVQERVGSKYLTSLYQVTSCVEKIEWELLPNSFVIKTNHDSGTVILVRDKDALDKRAAKKRLETSLQNVYGVESGEWAYALIKPQILVEELIHSNNDGLPADYKFHCVDGEIKWLQFIYDRGQNTKEVIVSRTGQPLDCQFDHKMVSTRDFRKPPDWENLCAVAEALAKGWKYVRIDLYLSGSRIYVGEMTFFPLEGCYRGAGQALLGQLLTFDRETFSPPIYQSALSAC